MGRYDSREAIVEIDAAIAEVLQEMASNRRIELRDPSTKNIVDSLTSRLLDRGIVLVREQDLD